MVMNQGLNSKLLFLCMIVVVLFLACGSRNLEGQKLHCVLRQEDIVFDVTYRETADKEERETVILGCVGDPYWLKGGVIEFNKSHSDCVIIMEDYWQEDEEAAVQALYRKVLTGKGPDIIAFDSMHVEDIAFGKSGMVEDLNAYLEKSSVIHKEDIIEPLYDALEVDDKLYMLPTNFGIDALITKEEWLNEDGGWDSEKMLALLEEHAGLEIYESQSEMLEAYALYGIAGQKGDETDREVIKDYLQIARMLPEWYDFPTDDLVKREGGALFQNIGIDSVEDYMCQTSFWGEDSAVVGYPEIKGNGMAFYPVNCFAISTKSKQKDNAWKFIESFFEESGEEHNASPDEMYFSICKDGLEEQFTKAMKREYYANGEGGKEELPIQTYYLGEELEEIYAAREEDIAKIKDMIQGIRVIRRQEDSLVNILLEEASVYFSGDKSLEEVTDIIESRLKLLWEERQDD
ncbi:MAG: extracellular solute-binding protein [Roseburia sp.]|nr:extracellular solute-binding protein [Roseburia sp.]